MEVKRSKIQQRKHRCQKKLLQLPTTGITSKQIFKQPSKLGSCKPSIKKGDFNLFNKISIQYKGAYVTEVISA